MINLEADNSTSHVRDEEQMNRHINAIQTNILNNKLQVTHEVAAESGCSDYQQMKNVGGNPYAQTNLNSKSQSNLNKTTTSQHYKPKRKSQQKSSGLQNSI